MSSNEPKKNKPITTSAESHFEPPEKIEDTLVVPPDTIYMIPDHPAFVNPPHFEKLLRERDWFTSFFYFCLPLTFGSQHGFIMKATYDFVVRWNGLPDIDAVDIHLLEEKPKTNYVDVASHFGHGIITVQSRYSFRTPKGVNLMVKEPPNYYVDGMSWLNAVVETDNLRRDFTFNIKVTRPNTDIYIRKGTPLGCIVPYPRYFLDKYTLEELKDPVELEKARRTISYFAEERNDYDFSKPRLRYMEGKDIYDYRFEQHQKTLDNGEWWNKGGGKTEGLTPSPSKAAMPETGNDRNIAEHTHSNQSFQLSADSPKGAILPMNIPSENAPDRENETKNGAPVASAAKCPVTGMNSAQSAETNSTNAAESTDADSAARCPMSGMSSPSSLTDWTLV